MAAFDFTTAIPVTTGLDGTNFFLGAYRQSDSTPFIATLDAVSQYLEDANVFVSTSGIFLGNASANLVGNSTVIQLGNTTSSANLSPTSLVIGTSVINSSAISSGSNTFMTVNKVFVGNTTTNTTVNSIMVALLSPTGSANLQSTGLTIGTSSVNAIAITALRFNTTGPISANGGIGSLGQVLMSNGSISFWANPPAGQPQGSNTTIQFNDSTAFGANDAFTFNKDTLTLNLGANVIVNTTAIFFGNSTANHTSNSTLISIGNATSTANLQPTRLLIGATVVNTAGISAAQINATSNVVVGGNITISTTSLSIGNAIASFLANSIVISIGNTTSTANLQPTQLVIGGTIVNSSVVTSPRLTITGSLSANGGTGTSGQVLTTNGSAAFWTAAPAGSAAGGDNQIQYNIGTSFNACTQFTFNPSTLALGVGANVTLDTTDLQIGNTTANMIVNSSLVQITNSTATANLQATQLVIGTSIVNTTAVVATSVNSGANVSLNQNRLNIGNTTANLMANSILLSVASGSGTANLTPSQLQIGTTTVNSTAVSTGQVTISGALSANGGVGSVGQSLQSDGTKSFWANSGLVAGGNTEVQYNASGSLGSNVNFTFNSATSTLNIGSNLTITTVAMKIGNATANSTQNSVIFQVSNATATANLTPTSLVIGTTTVAGATVTAPSVRLTRAALALANGLNSDIANINSFNRITGPGADFYVGGFSNTASGSMVKLYNSTAQSMTILNEDPSSTDKNRIKTLTGSDVVLRSSQSFAALVYDELEPGSGGTAGRWILESTN